MKFGVDARLFELYPKIAFGIVSGTVGAQKAGAAQSLQRQREKARAAAAQAFASVGIADHPHIAGWRDTYKAFGGRPKDHKPTHEAFARRMLKDPPWPSISLLVDVYLANQLEHLLPHGGYDLDRLSGTLHLARAAAGEAFEPLGGGSEATEEGEVVYRDGARILTRRWNYRDCDHTKILPATKRFLLMIEAASPLIADHAVNAAAEDLARRYAECFEGAFASRLLVATPASATFDI